jgi:hypothetical protein
MRQSLGLTVLPAAHAAGTGAADATTPAETNAPVRQSTQIHNRFFRQRRGNRCVARYGTTTRTR